VSEVREFLRERAAAAIAAGLDARNVWIDPGIGFGKSLAHNLALLARLDELLALGHPICLGVSRKAFVEKASGIASRPVERIGGTAAAIALGVERGASILRVHDARIMREAALVARAIVDARSPTHGAEERR
jgi:dihydropteroate synthase